MALPFDDPAYAQLLVAGNPVKMSTLKDRTSVEAPPKLGQHRRAILKELGLE
jgi:crotonobetainyl-CoA:carnitine CoA-transferase CaiB-like acyl-CoA transferase